MSLQVEALGMAKDWAIIQNYSVESAKLKSETEMVVMDIASRFRKAGKPLPPMPVLDWNNAPTRWPASMKTASASSASTAASPHEAPDGKRPRSSGKAKSKAKAEVSS